MKKIISVILLCAMALTLCACGDKGAKAFEEASKLYDAEDYDGAFAILDENRDSGNADVQTLLGDCYFDGLGTEQDYAKAAELYAAAAEQGNVNAQSRLGWMYLDGCGVKQDYGKALELCTKAYGQGNMNACFNLGLMYANGYGVTSDIAKAIELYTRAAESGNAMAQNNLGWCYYYGNGVDADTDKAAELFDAAASQGNIYAAYGMGLCHLSMSNYRIAFDSFTSAVDGGNSAAKERLGYCYLFGYGTDVDEAKAFELFTQAVAETQDIDAMYFLAQCYLFGVGTEQPDTDKAVGLFTSAAERGSVDAQVFLGELYLEIRDGYVEMDVEKGIKWLAMAADAGDTKSMYILEQVYRLPLYGVVDMEKGLEYCKMAVESGYAAAADDLYRYIDEMEDDEVISWLCKGAELGSMLCQVTVAEAYCDGEYGVEQDFAEAAKYLKMAKENTGSSNYNALIQLADRLTNRYPELKELVD